MKSTGISLYRVVTPIFVLAAVISAALFAFNESYLPEANRRQEALRAEIKGKPAQTFLLPGRTWISGQSTGTGEPTRIFYYQAFDPDLSKYAISFNGTNAPILSGSATQLTAKVPSGATSGGVRLFPLDPNLALD